MHCLWASYIHDKAGITELVTFAGRTKCGEITVARQDFSDLTEACTHKEATNSRRKENRADILHLSRNTGVFEC